MKVAIVLNTSWNIVNFRMGLIRALQQKGHSVVCIAPKDEYSEQLIEAGCEYYPLLMDNRGVNPFKDVSLYKALKKQYKAVRPDIILHYTIKPNIYGTLAANSLKIPVINNVCGLGSSFLNSGIITFIVKRLYKRSFKSAEKIFFQNSEDSDLFLSERLISKSQFDLLPGSGIDLEKFKPEIKDKNDRFTFLMISRLIKDKGIYEYVAAAKKFHKMGLNTKFQLLGPLMADLKNGSVTKEELEQWVNEGILEYLGTTDDVRNFIHQSDCVVLPSYREGTPKTLLEASSLAKPVVATKTAGCNQVVDNGVTGLLCKVKSSEDLYQKLVSISSLPRNKQLEMGNNGRKKMELQFDEQIVIKKYLDSIEEIVLSRP